MSSTGDTAPDGSNRREFLKRVAIDSALAAGVVGGGFALASRSPAIPKEDVATDAAVASRRPDAARPEAPRESVLAVARGDDPAAITRKAVEALGGMGSFVSKGDRVLLKPNIGWDRRPKFAANTNPDVVAAAARLCLDAGAREVVVTDSPCNNPQRCFDKSGLAAALAGLDVKLVIPTERHYVETDLGGKALGTWPVLRSVLESDTIINLPIAKHHSSAVLTLGMKNWFGILGGGKLRGRLHQEMALAIAELAEFVRPALTILDAYRILIRNGPQGGSLRDTKKLDTVCASADPVAIDAYASRFFELAPDQVPFVPIAAGKGLGTSDLDAVRTIEVS